MNSGNGKHFTLLTTPQQEKTILYTIAAFMPGVLSFGLPKMAVISLLTRLLNPSKKHRWFLWWMGYWCMLTLFATCGVLIGQCYPARSLWDFSVEGSCMPKSVLIAYCQYAGGMFGIERSKMGSSSLRNSSVTQHSPRLWTSIWQYIQLACFTSYK